MKNLKITKILSLSLLFCIISVMTLSFASCNALTDSDPLGYEKYPFTAKGGLCANESEYKFAITMNGKNNAELTFSAPETLRGYVFRISDEKTTLSYGDMTIDFNGGNGKTNVVKLLPALFSISKECIKNTERGISQNSLTLTKVTCDIDGVESLIYINEATGNPLRFEYGKTVIDVLEFTKNEDLPGTDIPNTTPAPTVTKGTECPPTATATPSACPTATAVK